MKPPPMTTTRRAPRQVVAERLGVVEGAQGVHPVRRVGGLRGEVLRVAPVAMTTASVSSDRSPSRSTAATAVSRPVAVARVPLGVEFGGLVGVGRASWAWSAAPVRKSLDSGGRS